MNNKRINDCFSKLKSKNKSALIAFLTSCDPNFSMSLKLLQALPKAGVDIIELGMPFSDPMADGPIIQRSYIRALKSGSTLKKTLNLVEKFRQLNNHTPIVLMGYYNPIHYYGNLKFVKKAVLSGIDGLIIVDLPMEEDEEFYNLSYKNNLPLIRLVTPTTDEERLKKILKNAHGFVYYVSVTGITGTKSASVNDVKNKIKVIKKITNLPVIAGFGIKNSVDAKKMSSISDGIVIGSSLVNKIEEVYKKKNGLNEIFKFLKSFK